MSAIKRVQKLLSHAERRSLDSFRAGGDVAAPRGGKSKGKSSNQEKQQEMQSATHQEEIFVKATGKAMEKALAVGKWFESRPDEYVVRVKTGSVLVVDDIVEDEEKKNAIIQQQQQQQQQHGDGTSSSSSAFDSLPTMTSTHPNPSNQQTRKGKKRKRTVDIDAELPESRTRWVNMVEVAVGLREVNA